MRGEVEGMVVSALPPWKLAEARFIFTMHSSGLGHGDGSSIES
jgi:hypothetical protein